MYRVFFDKISGTIIFTLVVLLFLVFVPDALDPTQHIRWIVFACINIFLLIRIRPEFNSGSFLAVFFTLLFIFSVSLFASINKVLFFTQYSKLVLFLSTTALIAKAIKDEKTFRLISFALLCTESLVLLLFLYSLVINYELIFPFNYRTMYVADANFMHKNLLASFLFLMILYKAIIYSFLKQYLKVLVGLSFIDLIAVIILQSRLTWVLCLVFVPLTIYFLAHQFQKTFSKKTFLIAAAVSLFATGVFLKSGFSKIIFQRFNDLIFYKNIPTELNSSKERVFLMNRTIEIIKENPFGIGLGNWNINFPKNGIAGTNWEQGTMNVIVAHTDLLSIVAQAGWLTILIIMLFLFYVYRLKVKSMMNSFSKENKYQSGLIAIVILACILLSVFDFAFSRAEHLFLLAIFIAVFYNKILSVNIDKKQIMFLSDDKIKAAPLLFILSFVFISIHSIRLNSSVRAKNLEELKLNKDWDNLKINAIRSGNYFYSVTELGIPVKWYEGFADYSLNNINSAYSNYTISKELTPYDINVLSNLGTAAFALGKMNVAKDNYDRALKISPNFNSALLNRAVYYYSIKEYTLMERDLEKIKDKTFIEENSYAIRIMKSVKKEK